MSTLSTSKPRLYEVNSDPRYVSLPMVATDIIYEGSAVGLSSGYLRPLVATDVFVGFAVETVDNSAGAAGDKSVKVMQQGVIEMQITGASAVTDINSTVYLSDDDTATKTSSGNSSFGKISKYVSGTTCRVFFQGAAVRSI